MKTTFEKLSEQEMISVNGGDHVLVYIDKDGTIYYIVIEDGR